MRSTSKRICAGIMTIGILAGMLPMGIITAFAIDPPPPQEEKHVVEGKEGEEASGHQHALMHKSPEEIERMIAMQEMQKREIEQETEQEKKQGYKDNLTTAEEFGLRSAELGYAGEEATEDGTQLQILPQSTYQKIEKFNSVMQNARGGLLAKGVVPCAMQRSEAWKRAINPRGYVTYNLTDSSSGGGGGASLQCIWVGSYDAHNHFFKCLNHPGATGSYNGVWHQDGKKDILPHDMPPMPPTNCDYLSALPRISCRGNCGYTETMLESQRPAHILQGNGAWGFSGGYVTQGCTVCGHWQNAKACTVKGVVLINSCATRTPVNGRCDNPICPVGTHTTTTSHSTYVYRSGLCNVCQSTRMGPTVAPPTIRYMPDNTIEITWRFTGFSQAMQAAPSSIWGGAAGGSVTYRNMIRNADGTGEIRIRYLPANVQQNSWQALSFVLPAYALNQNVDYQLVNRGELYIPPTNIAPRVLSASTRASGSSYNDFSTQCNFILQAIDDYTPMNIVSLTIKDSAGRVIIGPFNLNKNAQGKFAIDFPVPITSKGENFTLELSDIFGNKSSHQVWAPKTDSAPPSFTSYPVSADWSKQKTMRVDMSDPGVGQVQIAFNSKDDYRAAYGTGTGTFAQDYLFTGDVYTEQIRPIFAKDAIGNESIMQLRINKLDNTAPTITRVGNQLSANKNSATLTVYGNDRHPTLGEGSGTVWWGLDAGNGSPIRWSGSSQFTVTENGSYALMTKDQVGNISQKTSVIVSGIDKTAPVIAGVTVSPNGWVADNAKQIVASGSDSESGIKDWNFSGSSGDTGWVSGGQRLVNGVWNARARDYAGNISLPYQFEVAGCDTEIPKVERVEINPTGWTTQGTKQVNVIASDTQSGVAKYRVDQGATSGSWQTANSFDLANGAYVIRVKDNAGRESAAFAITVSGIDQDPPQIIQVQCEQEWSLQKQVSVTATDNLGCGIAGYAVSQSESTPGLWGETGLFTVIKNGNYWLWVKDKLGLVSLPYKLAITTVDNVAPEKAVVVAGEHSGNTRKFTITHGNDGAESSGTLLWVKKNGEAPKTETANPLVMDVRAGDSYQVITQDKVGNKSEPVWVYNPVPFGVIAHGHMSKLTEVKFDSDGNRLEIIDGTESKRVPGNKLITVKGVAGETGVTTSEILSDSSSSGVRTVAMSFDFLNKSNETQLAEFGNFEAMLLAGDLVFRPDGGGPEVARISMGQKLDQMVGIMLKHNTGSQQVDVWVDGKYSRVELPGVPIGTDKIWTSAGITLTSAKMWQVSSEDSAILSVLPNANTTHVYYGDKRLSPDRQVIDITKSGRFEAMAFNSNKGAGVKFDITIMSIVPSDASVNQFVENPTPSNGKK